jgi:hypothetical protein
MNTATKLAAFAAGLAVVFGVSTAVGSALGPHDLAVAGHDNEGHGHDAHGTAEDVAVPAGLQISQDGFTLALDSVTATPGPDRPLSFQIVAPDGRPVLDYVPQHERRLHLIVVRRDLREFRHVHPTLGPDGTWRIPVDLTPGAWRVFADFRPRGADPLVLGADLTVAGHDQPAAPPEPTRVSTVDGYTVRLDGDPAPGRTSELTVTVTRDGRPVDDLQPYLGAYGHLVALRLGDLAYLHVHPDGEPGDGHTKPGPSVHFMTEIPSSGTYGLFLDFKHHGVVRTAAFTVVVDQPGTPGTDHAHD